jgi:demethylmenaquinone methyltransferase/2-methoxy-6-polyprenyl-1,4-benzoquinol methylase
LNKYDFIAGYYDMMLHFVEKHSLRDLRKRFVPQIRGKTLDIAAGTGNNIAFYPINSTVTLIDKSFQMLKKAKKKADNQDRDLNLKFVRTSLELLPFEDKQFDTILSIDVFCSVKQPEKVLAELHRVLKDDGQIIFAEHMRTENILMDGYLAFITLFTYLFASSSMIRPTDKHIRHSDFVILEYEVLKGSFRYYLCGKTNKKTGQV